MNLSGDILHPHPCECSSTGGNADLPHHLYPFRPDELLDIYYNPARKNRVLLRNVPVNQEGVIPEPDVQRLTEWRKVLDETFEENLAITGIASAGNTREGRETWAPQN